MLWVISLAVLLISLAGNLIADTFLHERIAVIGSFVGLSLTHNSGVAFGVTFPPVIQVLLIACALVLVVRLALVSQGKANIVAFGLIIGGALANIADRLPDGLVTDYVQVGTFPVFNLADSCITIGAGLLILSMLIEHRRKG